MSLKRDCEECGTPFEAKTKRARFCKTACRVKANRRPTKIGRAKARAGGGDVAAEVVELDASGAGVVEDDGGLVSQVRQTLQSIGALATVAGMAALRVARQIDKGEDSGSAVATLSKELSRLMAEARAEAAPLQLDAADDVMARAAAKILRLIDEPA